jgi:histone-binding protein RBBP4
VKEGPARRRQQLYLSEQTDGSEPNKLVLVTADVARPRAASAEASASWGEQARSPHLSAPLKTLVHPGEVNKVVDVPGAAARPALVATHSDAKEVFVWDFDAQPDRAVDLAAGSEEGKRASAADAVLVGHTADAEFALAASSAAPLVASGGKDTRVLVWHLGDGASGAASGAGAELRPRATFEGHTQTVEDVAFRGGSDAELCSVADDCALLFWDARAAGGGPSARVDAAHGERDVHCVDWSALRPELVVTGAQDGGVRVWDRRALGAPLLALNHHVDAAMNVEWSPHRAGLFASGADDGLVCVWDLDACGDAGGSAAPRATAPAPPQLLFQHAGHQSPVVDFCWDPADPWALMSASVDRAAGGGGTLQLWRISDMVYRSEEEVIREMEPFREFIATGDEATLPPGAAPRAGSAAGEAAPAGAAAEGGAEPVAMEVGA